MSMHFKPRSFTAPRGLRRGLHHAPRALWAAPLLLAGCGVFQAPSFDLMTSAQQPGVPLGQYVPTTRDAPPVGAITPITPELTRQLRAGQSGDSTVELVKTLAGTPQPYRIGINDSLGITVFSHPELSGPVTGPVASAQDPTGLVGPTGNVVDSQGEIIYPFIGRVKVAGLTTSEATELIQQRLSRFLKEPQLVVRVASYRSQRAYAEGEVRNPGVVILNEVPLTLTEMLSRAGGFTPGSDRSKVTLIRNQQPLNLDIQALIERGTDLNRILIQANDVVRVGAREDSRVYVLGEVARTGPLPLRNGRLSLNEALNDVGGLNMATANPRQIYVIRKHTSAIGLKGTPDAVIYHLDARLPSSLVLADAFPLQPRDVVYVDPVPLVAWNRVLGLILPSANAALTASAVANIAAPR